MDAVTWVDTMIPVIQAPEPTLPVYDFHHDVYERGEDAIRQLAGQPPLRKWKGPQIEARASRVADITPAMLRAYPYWTRAMPALHTAYKGFCAYTARYIEEIEVPTTDHFVALRNTTNLMLAYTWSNYRLAHAYVNGRKSNIPNVLDPFDIKDGWFALDLGNFKTIVGPLAPANRVAEIQNTIQVLGLDEVELATTRRRRAELYWSPPPGKPPLPLWSLALDEPFLVQELRRQNRLNPGDT